MQSITINRFSHVLSANLPEKWFRTMDGLETGTISVETVGTPGNTVTLSGPGKQGKSAVGSVILTGAITCLACDGFAGQEVKCIKCARKYYTGGALQPLG